MRVGKAKDNSLFIEWAAVAPQQFQSFSSTQSIPIAFPIAITDSLYSREVPFSEHPG